MQGHIAEHVRPEKRDERIGAVPRCEPWRYVPARNRDVDGEHCLLRTGLRGEQIVHERASVRLGDAVTLRVQETARRRKNIRPSKPSRRTNAW